MKCSKRANAQRREEEVGKGEKSSSSNCSFSFSRTVSEEEVLMGS